ncbi:hypothetical protein B0H65DRAFT_146345 [Neurospora tetraspora]|uniref:Uncharacterized protein n=1 Tax=Neurospora tetraspora TaxID=94610 RepID=A0AAE0JGP5_9PEZI|nr:hypothetical protein B0H65DRAFT_146345 [Neurospora tetraspora]
MMSSGSFAAATGPFPYEAGAATGIGPNPGPGTGSGFGIHSHHQQPLPLDDTSVAEPIILDSTIPLPGPSTSQPPHKFNPFNTTQQQRQQNGHDITATLQLQLQQLQATLTQALSERDAARLSLATLRNELYNARQVEKRLRIERDEARAQVSFLKQERTQVRQTEVRLRRERNEARVALALAVQAQGGKLKGVGSLGKAQGGMKGIELFLGTGTRTAKMQGAMSGARAPEAHGQGIPGQQQLPQEPLVQQASGQAQAGAGAAAAVVLEGVSGAVTDFGLPLQQGFGADMDQQLEEFLIMHGVDSREASPVQQVPTPPGMGYGHEAGAGGQFEMMQS